MKRLMMTLRAIFDRNIHVLTEDDLFRHEIDAAETGYQVGYSDARLAFTGEKEQQYTTVAVINGIKVQKPLH